MQTGLTPSVRNSTGLAAVSAPELFRARFQRALRNCVRRRFSVAECFGVIWEETLEEVTLSDGEQAQLYDELLHWAKHRLFPELIQSHAPELFTTNHPSFRGRPDCPARRQP